MTVSAGFYSEIASWSWVVAVNFFNVVPLMHNSSDSIRLWVWLLLLRSEWLCFFLGLVLLLCSLTDRQTDMLLLFLKKLFHTCTGIIYVSLMIDLASSVEREKEMGKKNPLTCSRSDLSKKKKGIVLVARVGDWIILLKCRMIKKKS